MPKSGSSLLRYYVREMINLINPDAQLKLVELIRQGRINGNGQFVKKLDQEIAQKLTDLSLPDSIVLVKVHQNFSQEMHFLKENSIIIMTFNYRDPRDVVLSSMDHYRRAKEKGLNEFTSCDTFENAAKTVLGWSLNAVKWIQSGLALNINYEYFLKNKLLVLHTINRLGRFGLKDNQLQELILMEEKLRTYGFNQFNTGKLTRYQKEMTQEQIAYCNKLYTDLIPVLSQQRNPISKPK